LIVRLRAELADGSPITGAALRLNINEKKDIWLETSENGYAETRITFNEKGVHVLKASFESGDLRGETEAKIRIVNYREEIVDLFNSFLEGLPRKKRRNILQG